MYTFRTRVHETSSYQHETRLQDEQTRRYHEAFTTLPAAPSTPPVTPRRVLQPRPRTVPPHNGPATRLRSRHVAPRRCVCGSRGPSSPAPLHVAVSLYPAAATWASTRRSRRLIPPRLEAALISVSSRREAGAAVSGFTEAERPRPPPSRPKRRFGGLLAWMCGLYLWCTP